LERLPESAHDHSVLLSVKDLSVTYSMGSGVLGGKKTFQAVKNVSFEIQKGQTLALVGESGCGKTTIGKALLQLLTPQTMVSGQAMLQGQDLFQLQGQALQASRKQMQIIFQNPFASLNPRMRVQEILEEGMKSLHPEWSVQQRQADLKVLMDQVGLRTDALDRYPHEFSGGQRQRIAIARALAVKPSLIVCDEPTSALDVSVQAQILNLLRELQDHLGVSYLFVTHNIGVVAYLADKVAVMHAGEMVEMGDASQILNNPQDPYTKSLLSAVPKLNLALA
jgi:peptide/nickel transport system ATP-binding protein